MRARIRIESDTGMAHTSRVFVITDEGETEISSCVSNVSLTMKVGDANEATLTVLPVNVNAIAWLKGVEFVDLTPRRSRFRRILRDITTLGKSWRVYA